MLRCRRIVGALSARCRRVVGALSARCRRAVGALSARCRRAVGALSARCRRVVGERAARPWHIRRALKRALCIVVSIEHNASIIKQFLRITSFTHNVGIPYAAEESDCDSESEPISDRPSASQTSSPTPTNAAV